MACMDDRGFVRAVVMEGMIAVAILGIIAAIVVPAIVNYKDRPFREEARAHAYRAYEAAQAFFRANPNARADLEMISRYGYRPSPDVRITVAGNKNDLVVTSTHVKIGKTYRIDALGQLSTY